MLFRNQQVCESLNGMLLNKCSGKQAESEALMQEVVH